MKKTLKFNSFLVFNTDRNKYFFTEFGNGLNVIYGRNTAGKSTLIQLILYTLGINDHRKKLYNILSENLITRLECTINDVQTIFVREDDNLFIDHENEPVLIFSGISANQSAEHIKLKDYLHDYFNFNFEVEDKSGLTKAPIETIFLPYYISQSVGWVYLRKSFSNLEFYRDFKNYFLDYYLGIEDISDVLRKRELEAGLKQINTQIKVISEFENSNEEIDIAKLSDELHSENVSTFIEMVATKKGDIIELESKYVNKSNELSFLRQRKAVISKVKRNHDHQNPELNTCPTCTQDLPQSTESIYDYFQEKQDNEEQLRQLKEQIKSVQSQLNSISKKLLSLKSEFNKEYETLSKYKADEITLENWIDSKAYLKLSENLTYKLGELTRQKNDIKEELQDFKTEEHIQYERVNKSKVFESIFTKLISEMNLPEFTESRFTRLYEISSFPHQGVALLKTVMAYHFAFNKIISQTPYVHRLPFMLDGIFKEDVDPIERVRILKFIFKNKPSDTQTIISVADAKENESIIEQENDSIFESSAKLICIADGINQRALLSTRDNEEEERILDTYRIIETV